jgi:hypothetical protein
VHLLQVARAAARDGASLLPCDSCLMRAGCGRSASVLRPSCAGFARLCAKHSLAGTSVHRKGHTGMATGQKRGFNRRRAPIMLSPCLSKDARLRSCLLPMFTIGEAPARTALLHSHLGAQQTLQEPLPMT